MTQAAIDTLYGYRITQPGRARWDITVRAAAVLDPAALTEVFIDAPLREIGLARLLSGRVVVADVRPRLMLWPYRRAAHYWAIHVRSRVRSQLAHQPLADRYPSRRADRREPPPGRRGPHCYRALLPHAGRRQSGGKLGYHSSSSEDTTLTRHIDDILVPRITVDLTQSVHHATSEDIWPQLPPTPLSAQSTGDTRVDPLAGDKR